MAQIRQPKTESGLGFRWKSLTYSLFEWHRPEREIFFTVESFLPHPLDSHPPSVQIASQVMPTFLTLRACCCPAMWELIKMIERLSPEECSKLGPGCGHDCCICFNFDRQPPRLAPADLLCNCHRRCRAKRRQLEIFGGLLPESQGKNLVLTLFEVLFFARQRMTAAPTPGKCGDSSASPHSWQIQRLLGCRV